MTRLLAFAIGASALMAAALAVALSGVDWFWPTLAAAAVCYGAWWFFLSEPDEEGEGDRSKEKLDELAATKEELE